MRRLRGDRTLSSVAEAAGIAKGELSMYERGFALPPADHVGRLVPFYGNPSGWWPPSVLRVLADGNIGPGCGEELDPGASRRRIYHNEACRAQARKEK